MIEVGGDQASLAYHSPMVVGGCLFSDARSGFVSMPGVSDISSGWLLDPPL